MSEYEIIDTMNNLHGNFLQGQFAYFSIITAYTVVAYSVGRKLTTFQSTFASLLMVIFVLMSLSGQYHDMSEIYHYAGELEEFRQRPIVLTEPTRWGFVMRPLLVVGALIFMWQVRHSRTD